MGRKYLLLVLFIGLINIAYGQDGHSVSIRGLMWYLPPLKGSSFGVEKMVSKSVGIDLTYMNRVTIKSDEYFEEYRLRPGLRMYFKDEKSCRCLNNFYATLFYEYARRKNGDENIEIFDPTHPDYFPELYYSYTNGIGTGVGKLFMIKERFVIDAYVAGLLYSESKEFQVGEEIKAWKNAVRMGVSLGFLF